MLCCDIIEGAFDMANFYMFIKHTLDQMQPFPAPNSVIIMDNGWIHKHLLIVELIKSRYAIFNLWCDYILLKFIIFSGMQCEFLPPYSLDYNPIELLFSSMKYYLCQNSTYVHFAMNKLSNVEIYCILCEALYQATLQEIFGWYRHCGYV